jgi:hypothetical protein
MSIWDGISGLKIQPLSKHEMSGSFGRTVIEERLKTFYEYRPNLGTLRELATRVSVNTANLAFN